MANASTYSATCSRAVGSHASVSCWALLEEGFVVALDLVDAVGNELDAQPPPIGRVGLAPDEARPLEPVEDAGDGAGRQAGQLSQARRLQPGLGRCEDQTAQIRGVDAEPLGDRLVGGDRSGDQSMDRACEWSVRG